MMSTGMSTVLKIYCIDESLQWLTAWQAMLVFDDTIVCGS